jgi:hypothetical protein
VTGRLGQAAAFGGAAAAMCVATVAVATICPGTCANCAACTASVASMGSAVGAVGIALGGSVLLKRRDRGRASRSGAADLPPAPRGRPSER